MNAKKIISYTLLGIITALIITVIILSFVTKKISVSSSVIMPESPAEICVSKYEDGKEYQYRMQRQQFDSSQTIKQDYEAVLKKFDGLGYFTFMQQLFLGLGSAKPEINYGKTTSISDLHQKDGGYLVEFAWTTGQTLKNSDGTVYKNHEGNEVTFTKLDLFVDSSDEVASYKIYIKTYTLDSTSVYYTYTIYADVLSLYDLASGFDKDKKLQGAIS